MRKKSSVSLRRLAVGRMTVSLKMFTKSSARPPSCTSKTPPPASPTFLCHVNEYSDVPSLEQRRQTWRRSGSRIERAPYRGERGGDPNTGRPAAMTLAAEDAEAAGSSRPDSCDVSRIGLRKLQTGRRHKLHLLPDFGTALNYRRVGLMRRLIPVLLVLGAGVAQAMDPRPPADQSLARVPDDACPLNSLSIGGDAVTALSGYRKDTLLNGGAAPIIYYFTFKMDSRPYG